MPDPWLDISLDTEAPVPPRPTDAPPLDYSGYLGLDRLLAAGEPVSRVPDERAFLATHQLIEVAFRLMTADLVVVAATLDALADDMALATEPMPDERGPSAFWRPALTAAGRLRHTARTVLPAAMRLLGRSDDGAGTGPDVLFSSIEFGRFRDALVPSSGFQTAQLRLIQRALGKEALLRLPVFPGDTFSQHYAGCPAGHVALGDPVILRETGHARVFPTADDAPERRVGALDATAHRTLARLAPLADGLPPPPAVRPLHADDAERAVARVRQTLGEASDAEAVTARFREALGTAVDAENARRASLTDARRGAQALTACYRRSCLAFVLDRVAATDAALHAPERESFLTVHRQTVRRHVSDGSGTGGGGMPYLVTSQRFLLPLFPALVAYADLSAGAGSDDDPDRW